MVSARIVFFKVFYAGMIGRDCERRRLQWHSAAHRNVFSVLQQTNIQLIYMYLVFYDLYGLTQYAVNIQCLGDAVAVLLYSAALALLIRKD